MTEISYLKDMYSSLLAKVIIHFESGFGIGKRCLRIVAVLSPIWNTNSELPNCHGKRENTRMANLCRKKKQITLPSKTLKSVQVPTIPI
jgi:hypothetical protein